MNYRRYCYAIYAWLNICLLASICAQPTVAQVTLTQPPRSLTAEDIVGVNRASDVQMALDGRSTAFVVTAWDRAADRFNSDIWTVQADLSGTARQLTFNARRDDHPRWSPRALRLAFLSEREASSAESRGAQIYLLDLQGGDAVPLTSHGAAIQTFEWSPDGRYIAFIAEEPQVAAKGKPPTKAPIVVDAEARYAQLWLLEVETGHITQFTKGARHVAELAWSFDGAQLVCTARATPQLASSGTTEVYVLPVDMKAAPHALTNARQLSQGNGAELQPRFSPDGRWVSWLAHSDGDPTVGPDRIHLVPVNAAGTVIEPRVLARNFNGYVRSYRWLYNSAQLIFQADLGLYGNLYLLDLSDRPPQAMTRGEGVCGSFATSPEGSQLVYTFEHPRMAMEVAGLNARTLLPMQLTQLNPQFNELALGQVETIKWRAPGSTPSRPEIEGLLIYPVGYESGKRYPLMTYIHGGPESAYTRSFNASWSAPVQLLAGQGYTVFLPNFRGSSNYGARFAQANALQAGQVDYDDVLSGIDELIKRGFVDETRLAVGGWSYGGYLSGWIIGHTPRFKCAVYGAGLSNAVSYWGTADITHQRERLHGGTPWDARKLYAEQSPLTYLAQATTPTLIFHGEKDERVPLGQSQESYRTLKRVGVPVQLVIYPEQGHGLTTPSYQLDKLRRELAWLESYLASRKM